MTEQDKVTVDDIIGIVKTEEQTNSVEEVRKLRGRGNETAKRFSKYVPDSYNYTSVITIVDNKTGKRSGSIDDFVDLLNEQYETIQRLQENITELLSVNVEEELLKENEQLKKSIDCQNKTIKEQCIKIDWASECGVKWDKEFKNWRGFE